ncbi:HTH_Tnp_Tc3_2 domain-containing protein [Trichonephila clavipes]|nr:HTH_Tnp_Tc3_2 domain-containing protein [Trichonephila clavipes]
MIEHLCEVQHDDGGQLRPYADKHHLARAARALLSSVTRILLLADTVVVKQLLNNKDRVSISLNRLENVANFTEFVKAFSQFGTEMVEMANLMSRCQNELWFQQHGATCHTARATIDLLKDTFGDRLISRSGPVNWPPRSCDLTPLDYFLWGYVKSLVYADKPQALDHLEDNIRRVIADIRPQMLEKVIENWTSRLDYIRATRLREAGWSNRRIGRPLGRSDMVFARCWQQWITEGRVYRRGGSGRPRNTNDREDRAIRRVATSAPTTSLASIQRHLPPSRHPAVSTGFLPTSGNLSVTDWRRVIFSDESRFSLSDDDHRTRRTGQRSDPAFIVERHTAISQGVTVWGAISWDTRSSLVVLQGTLTARRYVDDILTPIVLPMLSSRPGAIYQQDNARPHTSPNNVFKDMTSYHGLAGHQIFRQLTRWEGNCSRPEIQEN